MNNLYSYKPLTVGHLRIKYVCRRVKFEEPSNGFALVGHVFVSITLITRAHMNNHRKNQCIMEKRCRSINIEIQVSMENCDMAMKCEASCTFLFLAEE
ncbi:hypothetical protein pdam_00018398 [Pocillopora damicornis]|uniref:Uncharacterized protein n=1 Tax=Pocillopora damicornis TaxID=46731 RepID=A0A3M6UL23_POCDA|nr:hypothetical protein pdam_00018398 [Pocillopora damicornis]